MAGSLEGPRHSPVFSFRQPHHRHHCFSHVDILNEFTHSPLEWQKRSNKARSISWFCGRSKRWDRSMALDWRSASFSFPKAILDLNQGTLYPARLRLEQRRWIKSRWGTSDNNRKAKFYELTARGRRQIAEEQESWEFTVSLMERFLRKPAEGKE